MKDATDRYDNIEVDYLLQGLEEHNDLVSLATNRTKSYEIIAPEASLRDPVEPSGDPSNSARPRPR